ncbi:S26 family signal peptidase [Mesomycoplasma dispar]|uniref:S26 family signal peptidase n=1 Tax=Mesomycoplasma dispar TaxID=86660 RepID=UPI003A7F3F55
MLINGNLFANFSDLGFWKFNGIIPGNKFFVLGENINFSNDSRVFNLFDLNTIRRI